MTRPVRRHLGTPLAAALLELLGRNVEVCCDAVHVYHGTLKGVWPDHLLLGSSLGDRRPRVLVVLDHVRAVTEVPPPRADDCPPVPA